MEHYLKTWPKYFTRIASGEKTFEIRNNDRDFQTGDVVLLQEYNPDTQQYTGREIWAKISYVLHEHDGLYTGYVIFQMTGIMITKE